MHWIIGDIRKVTGKVPDNVRLDTGIPILAPVKKVQTVTYLVDTEDSLDRVARGINVLRWAMSNGAQRLRVNDRELATFLQGFGGSVTVLYDAKAMPPATGEMVLPEWWTGPNYIR